MKKIKRLFVEEQLVMRYSLSMVTQSPINGTLSPFTLVLMHSIQKKAKK
jgi:hypothetical protein